MTVLGLLFASNKGLYVFWSNFITYRQMTTTDKAGSIPTSWSSPQLAYSLSKAVANNDKSLILTPSQKINTTSKTLPGCAR